MRIPIVLLLSAGLLTATVSTVAQEPVPPPNPSEELPAGAEALTSGPVHEAFAQPVAIEMQAGVIAPKAPPANINESPPADRPAGASIEWIPGYWAWDSRGADFIWVSGCWRVAPPNMYWVPGYWAAVAEGFEWVAGFWALSSGPQQQIEYLPPPPEPVGIEAPGPAPTIEQIWIPGCWYWYEGRYVMRRGYWLAPAVGWVWDPSHYTWTPRGYVFCPGHWDHDLEHRGVLFTPVHFPPVAAIRVGFVFAPSLCVDLGALQINLFTYPRYRHYYFGDFYDDAFIRIGLFPRFECDHFHTWYDPLYVHDRWNARQEGPAWDARVRHDYEVRRADPSLRPARTFGEQEARMVRMSEPERRNFEIAQPLKTYAAGTKTRPGFERIDATERQRIALQSKNLHEFRDQRTAWEAAPKAPAAPPLAPPLAPKPPANGTEHKPGFVPPRDVRATQPEREKIPAPPIIHRPAPEPAKERIAPPHPAEERSHAGAPKDSSKDGGKDH